MLFFKKWRRMLKIERDNAEKVYLEIIEVLISDIEKIDKTHEYYITMQNIFQQYLIRLVEYRRISQYSLSIKKITQIIEAMNILRDKWSRRIFTFNRLF